MISVIVPVYNVEPYLRKCLDSIIEQTYKDIEILIIDDGSTDGSSFICDEYAKRDVRIKVFHTKNRGLSAARNLGLDKAKGKWIGFVDSDDWVEPDMYESLLNRAEDTRADIVECGLYLEEPRNTRYIIRDRMVLTSKESIHALLNGKLNDGVWNKIWKKRCFEKVRFIDKRVFEEIALTYKVLLLTNTVATIDDYKYHYFQRNNSLSKKHDIDNLIGYWLSNYERYEDLYNQIDSSTDQALLKYCASAVSRMWAYFYDCAANTRHAHMETIKEMCSFTKKNIPLFGKSEWRLNLRIGIFFAHFDGSLSFRLSWFINHCYNCISTLLNK